MYQETLRELSPRIVSGTLSTLVASQQEEWQSEQPDPTSLAARKALFNYYRQSEMFRRAYQEAIRFHCLPRQKEQLKEFRGYFAGRIFHDLAQIFVSARLSDSRILLSPERTLEFYKDLYPNTWRTRHSFSLDSLEGISVPDGLIVKKENGEVQIAVVCEYTLQGDEQNLRHKHDGFKKRKNNFPELFPEDVCLLFVMPKSVRFHKGSFGGIQFQEMPFTHSQFRNFFDSFYDFYRPDSDSATLAEIQARVEEQCGRGQERYRASEPLTPEETEYLIKCGR